MRRGKNLESIWKALLLSQAEKEYDALSDAVSAAALVVLYKLAADPMLEGSSAVGGHQSYYRTAFYREQYRMIYKVSKSRCEVVVTRIRRKDEKTYRGYEPQRRVP
jgi:mRNA-degrading endonuclease RelE of RelBE toxin-antitoxin system